MRDFRIDVEIRAPAGRVWAVMRDIERWPKWTQAVTRIRKIVAAHSGWVVALVRQPKLPPARWQVIEFEDENRTFTWMTRGPGIR